MVKDEDGHYLRSSDFDSMTDDDAVYQHTLDLIAHMNGAANFHSGGNIRPVQLDEVCYEDEEGKRRHHVYRTIVSRVEVRSTVSRTINGEGDAAGTPQHPTEAEKLAALSRREQSVADALRFHNKGDWVSLYKAWEVVGDAAGNAHEIVNKGWADKKTQGRFTGTAQSRAEIGDDARHASEKYKPPKNPMSLGEARAFVQSVIWAWTRTL
jgi:hypothetical protein